jgi:type VI secretion system secreted protein Hcp
MAADYFLKIDGIKGESLADKHKDEIDILSFSWGVSQTGTRYGGGGGEGKATFHDLSFVHKIDKSSPVLMQTCASGMHIKEATMVGEKSSDRGGGQFLKYTFTDVIISSYQDAASQAGDVTNVAALRFASVKVEAAPGARVDVRPAALGSLRLDPGTGEPTVVEDQTGLLLSGPVINPDGILIGLLRGISEFSLGEVPGLITGPTPHMRLVLGIQEVRTLSEQPPATTDLAAVNDLITTDGSQDKPKKPKQKSLQHNLYWYAPADLELTPDDFGRKGRRLGQIQLDPDGEPLQQDFDLTVVVLEGGFDSIGIRIQSATDHAKPGGEDEDPNESENEGASAESRAAGRNPSAFLLTLEVVAD